MSGALAKVIHMFDPPPQDEWEITDETVDKLAYVSEQITDALNSDTPEELRERVAVIKETVTQW